MLAKTAIYSGKTNLLYLTSNPDALGISTSVKITAMSIENPTCMNNPPTALGGWALTATTATTIGSTASGTPLTVPAPLELP
jgi:hypothetical protein